MRLDKPNAARRVVLVVKLDAVSTLVSASDLCDHLVRALHLGTLRGDGDNCIRRGRLELGTTCAVDVMRLPVDAVEHDVMPVVKLVRETALDDPTLQFGRR